MRGKAEQKFPGSALPGITPAHAGKSSDDVRQHICPWDHPRVCGEKVESMLKRFTALGSPPRMRGKGVSTILTYMYFRITPAYAGKSPSAPVGCRSCQDHPRVCGEKWYPGEM